MNLLDWSEQQLARSSDPETSKASAIQVNGRLVGLRARFVEGVRACGGRSTANEAAAAVADDFQLRESIRKRARECQRYGFVRLVGERVCSVSGNRCQLYEVTDGQ